MLINLSNHPLGTWPKPQIDAALAEFGEIQDFSFPNVEPDWDEEQIMALADQISADIMLRYGQNIAAVHVMGEFNLTFSLVKRFSQLGYPCVASTTKRIVEEHGDGTKTVKFEFCKFRRYE